MTEEPTPHAERPDGEYPDGEYPHGERPDGEYPHGERPDGYELGLGPAGQTYLLRRGASVALVGAGTPELLSQLLGGPHVALILPDSAEPLHPAYSLGRQIADALDGTRRAALDRAVDLLELAGVPEPHHRIDARPHQLTALDRQRAQLALAAANSPALLLAEDPCAGLSATDTKAFGSALARLLGKLACTLLVATTEVASAERLVDEIVMLEDGRITERRRRQAPVRRPPEASVGQSSSSST